MESLLSAIALIVYFGIGWLIYLYYQKHEGLDEYRGQRTWAWILAGLWLYVGGSGEWDVAVGSIIGYGENNR